MTNHSASGATWWRSTRNLVSDLPALELFQVVSFHVTLDEVRRADGMVVTELVQRVGRDPNGPISLRPHQQRRRAQVAPRRDEEGSLTRSVGQRGLNHREPLEPTGDLELSQVLGQLCGIGSNATT